MHRGLGAITGATDRGGPHITKLPRNNHLPKTLLIDTLVNMKTQHEAALEVAETIRAFREEFPFDADRLLVQYADLQPTRSNDEVIKELREETYRLTQEAHKHESDLAEAHTRIQTLEMEAAE